MSPYDSSNWQDKLVDPERVFAKMEPGMNVFIGTGVAEPRTLVGALMKSETSNLQDLTFVQLVSFGDAISLEALAQQKYRLKTVFFGWVASEAIRQGRVDLIPSRYSRVASLINSGRIPVDAAFVQVTPPNPAGYCSLGPAVDVSRLAMKKAKISVGEINRQIPLTLGDTFVHVSEFDYLVNSDKPPFYFPRYQAGEIFDRVARNIAAVIDDGACLGFSIGPIYDALARQLTGKTDLGIHSPMITDALMDLIRSGAVSNRHKGLFKGKSLVSYAMGSRELMKWLDRNPLIEFQRVDLVFNPQRIAQNKRYMAVFPARKVDLTGQIALHFQKSNIANGPGEVADFFNGAEMSEGGRNIFALPSRNLKGEANILLSVEPYPNIFNLPGSVDMVATEYGMAYLMGRSVRERAQALIEIAHPQDRPRLVEEAKAKNILYQDQIFLADSAHLYPDHISSSLLLKDGRKLRMRAIKPSDEEEMRRLFYRFSEEGVYYRYFSPIKTMPHAKMQEYVNVDYGQVMSIVGLVGDPGEGRLVAEARYSRSPGENFADVAFVVDEDFQGQGIASKLYAKLVEIAKSQGISGFTADVLATNRAMMKVFEQGGLAVEAKMEGGEYHLIIPFDPHGHARDRE